MKNTKSNTVEWSCNGFRGYRSNAPHDKQRRREQRATQAEYFLLKDLFFEEEKPAPQIHLFTSPRMHDKLNEFLLAYAKSQGFIE